MNQWSDAGAVHAALCQISRSDEEAFTGPVGMTLDAFKVSDEEGQELIETLKGCDPVPIALPGAIISPVFTICYQSACDAAGEVAAYYNTNCIGVYAGSCLYVAPAFRGRRVGQALCIAAAVVRGGSVIGDWEMHGYCEQGLAAHERAHAAVVRWSCRHEARMSRNDESGPHREVAGPTCP